MTAPTRDICYVTLGCAKNEVDTDAMRARLSAAGYGETDDPELASCVLINTCSFLASATSESIEATLELAGGQAGADITRAPIVMCGCVPSRYGDDLPEQLPEVQAFVRTDEEDRIVAAVDRVCGVDRPLPPHVPDVVRTAEGSVAYVKISDGCDRMCAFCAIPYIRGRYHSRPASEILDEADALTAGGVREVVLIGQDTGVWGCDLPEDAEGPHDLAQLLRAVAGRLRGRGVWLRVLYLQPEGMTDELISTIRDVPEVLPYIDIPIQHCDAHVLKAMRRTGSRRELEELFDRLRAQIPGMVIRTTGMAGFPGETDEQADELLEFLAEQQFDYVSVFSYSPEDGTLGARLPDQVPDDVKLERTQELMDLAEELGFSATASHVGETVDVIVDGAGDGDEGPELIGHAWFQASDCDGAVHIQGDVEAAVGDVLRVELTDSACYELFGHVVEGA